MSKSLDEIMKELEEEARKRMGKPSSEETVYAADETVPERGADETVFEPAADETVFDEAIGEKSPTVPRSAGNQIKPSPEIPENSLVRGSLLLNTYRIDSDPIHGGMGSVWRVHHTNWNADLAMKRPQAKLFKNEKQKEDFIRECNVWMDFGLHPNIVSCYYVREIDSVPTIFSEWMDGGSLEKAIRSEKLYSGSEDEKQERILDIAIQFARGLNFAHKKGIIHQDVKPDNLLLSKDWDAKVADFGLAKARAVLTAPESSEAKPGMTLAAQSGGYTPAYCSMEQMDGKVLTRRTDIYSWAVSVMEMYMGERPWANGVIAGLSCTDYLENTKVPLPGGLKELLTACMNAEPDDRPKDFDEIESALLEIYSNSFGKKYPRPLPKAASDTAESLNNRALSCIDLGQTKKAEELFDAAVKANPQSLQSVYNRALFQWRAGKITDAEAISSVSAVAYRGKLREQYVSMLKAESGMPEKLEYHHPCEETVDTMVSSGKSAAGWHQDSGQFIYFTPSGTINRVPLDARIMFGISREEMGFDGNNTNLALALSSEKKIKMIVLKDGYCPMSVYAARSDTGIAAVALFKTKIAYAMGDGELFLYDFLFGRHFFRCKYLEGPGQVSCMAFSEDGSRLVVGYSALVASYNSRQLVHILDVSDGRLLQTLPLHDCCRDLKIKGDIVTVWTGTSHSNWSISTGERLSFFEPQTAKTGRSCLSQNGRYILISRDASVSEIWDSEERRCIRTIKLPALPVEPGALTHGEIREVAFPEGRVLISGDNGVFDYDITEERPAADWALCVISDYKKTATAEERFDELLKQADALYANDIRKALALVEDARKIEGFENNPRALELKVKIYSSASKGPCTIKNVFLRAVRYGNIEAMSMDRTGRFCAAIESGRAILLSVPELTELASINFNNPTEISISGDGRFVLLASETERRFGVYDTEAAHMIWIADFECSEICTIDCSNDGNLGLVQYDMCRLVVFGLENCSVFYNRREPRLSFNKVRFTPDSRHIAAASNGGSGTEYNDIEIYNAEDFTLAERIKNAGKGGVNDRSFPDETKLVFTSSWDRHVYLADRSSSRREGLQWHDHAPTALCAMADGSHIFSGDQEGIICMQRVLPQPEFDYTLHSEVPADRIKLTKNGRYMAVMSYGRQIALYELDLDYPITGNSAGHDNTGNKASSDLGDILADLELEARRRMK